MIESAEQILQLWSSLEQDDGNGASSRYALPDANQEDSEAVAQAIIQGLSEPPWSGGQLALAANLFPALVQRARQRDAVAWDEETAARLGEFHAAWPEQAAGRSTPLQLLAAARSPACLGVFAERMAKDAPADPGEVAVLLSPLLQRQDYDPAPLFPRLLDAIQHLPAAASVLDLANHLTRSKQLPKHPASERVELLIKVLGGITLQLQRLEERELHLGDDEAGRRVAESVAIGISVCNALGLLKDPRAATVLHQLLDRKHRRLQVEAAAALAALDDPRGREELQAWASEPVVRLYVLDHARELGLLETIDAPLRSEAALAEAQVALWLSQPSQFGMAPSQLDALDQRELFWPGFEDPVTCYLFRFTYDTGNTRFSNIAVAGPMTWCFMADLNDLPLDDLYAAFAGWQAEHEEIYEIEWSELQGRQRMEGEQLLKQLPSSSDPQPQFVGYFFGQTVLAALATREPSESPRTVLIDGDGVQWQGEASSPRAPGAADWYCIYKGRQLLANFNRTDESETV